MEFRQRIQRRDRGRGIVSFAEGVQLQEGVVKAGAESLGWPVLLVRVARRKEHQKPGKAGAMYQGC